MAKYCTSKIGEGEKSGDFNQSSNYCREDLPLSIHDHSAQLVLFAIAQESS